jgi:hypothetical protein
VGVCVRLSVAVDIFPCISDLSKYNEMIHSSLACSIKNIYAAPNLAAINCGSQMSQALGFRLNYIFCNFLLLTKS